MAIWRQFVLNVCRHIETNLVTFRWPKTVKTEKNCDESQAPSIHEQRTIEHKICVTNTGMDKLDDNIEQRQTGEITLAQIKLYFLLYFLELFYCSFCFISIFNMQMYHNSIFSYNSFPRYFFNFVFLLSVDYNFSESFILYLRNAFCHVFSLHRNRGPFVFAIFLIYFFSRNNGWGNSVIYPFIS